MHDAVKVQIYEHVHPDDVRASVQAGVDFIGVKPGAWGRSEGEVDFATCRGLYAVIPETSPAMRNALTVSTDLGEICDTVQGVQPDVLHLSGDIRLTPPSLVEEIRRLISPVKVMIAVPVTDFSTVARARSYARCVDYILLDTPAAGGVVGATGETHDFAVSAETVRRVPVPVLLAGGLHADNVQAAIRQVRPWGVDSFTHTNESASRRKDPHRVRAFTAAARLQT